MSYEREYENIRQEQEREIEQLTKYKKKARAMLIRLEHCATTPNGHKFCPECGFIQTHDNTCDLWKLIRKE